MTSAKCELGNEQQREKREESRARREKREESREGREKRDGRRETREERRAQREVRREKSAEGSEKREEISKKPLEIHKYSSLNITNRLTDRDREHGTLTDRQGLRSNQGAN